MALTYVNGKMVDIPDKNPNALPKSIKPSSTAASPGPQTGPQTPAQVSPKSGRKISRKPGPSVKKGTVPKGASANVKPGQVGLKSAPRATTRNFPVGKVSPLGALGGASGVVGATELLTELTPEGYGPKAGYGNEQSPRDYNTYQGPLAAFGKVGEGLDAFASSTGRALAEMSLHLPPALGGYRDARGNVPVVEDRDKAQSDEWYQERYGVSPEGYGYLASGTDAPPLPRLEMMPSHGPNEPEVTTQPAPEPPIEIIGDDVRANPRYGKPEAPDMTRRGLAERLGDVTGGGIPDSMEGFMVANYMQNQLRQDDSRRVGDAKDIYKADLSALPSYMAEDRAWEMLPYNKQAKEAYANQTQALADSAPVRDAQTKAETAKTLKETKEMLTNDQAMAQATDQDLRKTATALAKEAIRANPELNEDPTTIANETAAIYAMLKLRHQQIQKGAMPEYVPGKEDTAWFSDNSTQPALEWNFTE